MHKYCLLLLLVCLCFPTLAQDSSWQLDETLFITLSDNHFNIAYPSNWQTSFQRDMALISEFPQDQRQPFDETVALEGYVISFQSISVRSLRQMGISRQEDSLETTVAKLADIAAYAAEREISETSLLTWPALRLRTRDSMGNHLISIIAYQHTDLLRLTFYAPSTQSLEAFLPTWDRMLESIQIQSGTIHFGDYSLNLECHGTGSPTIILESGWQSPYTYWTAVVQEMSQETRICASSRRSELGIGAVQQHSQDLYQLLELAGIEPPYLMVGHSYGGFTSRVFADEYPETVIGMVLVDSSVAGQLERFAEVMDAEIVHPYMVGVVDENLPFPYFATSSERVAEILSLGDIPLIVLSAENFAPASIDPIAIQIETELRPIWIHELQASLLQLSSNSRQILVPHTNHLSIVWHPATVDAIREVLESVPQEVP